MNKPPPIDHHHPRLQQYFCAFRAPKPQSVAGFWEASTHNPYWTLRLWHTHHDIQALVGGSLCHNVLYASLIDIHGPAVLDHCTSNVEVLGAVHLVIAIEEVEASFICKS